jgi:hypothetical protein
MATAARSLGVAARPSSSCSTAWTAVRIKKHAVDIDGVLFAMPGKLCRISF